ncbi:MAG: hypothetical protein IKQ72_01805 [Bacteroidaceae bacterium]|nr:hypothetical protein [Bacteroidaceae bacterium]
MNKTEYISPTVTVRRSQLRSSLLAGSSAGLSNGKAIKTIGLGDATLTGSGKSGLVTQDNSLFAW